MWQICRKLKKMAAQSLALIAVMFLIAAWVLPAQAAPTNVPIIGEIEAITLDDPATADPYARGRIVVGGQSIILPKNLLIDLPANRLSLWQIFDQAPAGCKAARQTGLAKTDTCNATGTGGIATITAVRTNAGDVIAGDVFIEKAAELVTGTVTYIDYVNGFFRVNGGADAANTGAMIRLNDPTSRHTIQRGPGCAGGPNCSADPRFGLDPDNYVITFTTGYPACIPSTVPRTFPGLPAAIGIPAIPAGTTQADATTGAGDLLCPSTNRNPAFPLEPPVADSRRFAPIIVGDSVTAEGNFETVGGVRFLSTHTLNVQKAISTRNSADQPDYIFLEEVLINVPGFYNQRVMSLFIGFATLAPTDVDIWSLHRDPVTNAVHEFPLASVQGCDAAAGAGTCGNQGLVDAGANIFKLRYDVDFIQALAGNPAGGADAKLSPCLQLRASTRFAGQNVCPGGGTFAENFGILSPAPHEIQARSGHSITFPGLVTLDINGAAATNGQYLFPLGLNLGGLEAAEMVEVDLNKTNLPTIFEGIPWNLDRRLGPSGCLNAGGCELGTLGGTFALDPFPYTGIEPRSTTAGGAAGSLPQGTYPITGFNATALPNASNRIFSYVDAALGKFNGGTTVLPYAPGTLPVDPPAQGAILPIAPVPLQCVAGGFAPVAQNDTAVTNAGVSVNIPVLFNDVTPVGVMNFASVTIVSGPTGTALARLDGTVDFTPSLGFSGTTTFTYTVAELAFGGVSNAATVTVTVIGLPVAVDDNVVTNKNVPALITVLVNDSSPSGILIPSSVSIVTGPTTTGTAVVNAANGTITYTPFPGFSGNDTFTYTVKDNAVPQQTSAPATVTVFVNDLATLPLAINDAVATAPSTTVTISVLDNDLAFGATLDPASVAGFVSALTPTTSGTLVTGVTGTVDFIPAPGFSGTASFTYRVNDSVPLTSNLATVIIIVSSPPVTAPDGAVLLEDTAAIIDLTANDTDPDGDMQPSTATVSSGPAHGTVTNLGTGTVVYTPALNFNGVDSFTYTVKDLPGGVSLATTVSVTVTPVNDPPAAGGLNIIMFEDNLQSITLAGTDPDLGDVLTYTITSSLLNGALTGIAPNLTYTPNLNFNGPAFFTYTVSDGVFTSAPASVAITVTPVNDPPITVNDTVNTAFNLPVTINVLANDIDVDGTIASSTIIATQPANGTVTVNALAGVVTYTPSLNFSGVNTFTYTVADNLGVRSLTATVTVNVANATGAVAVARAQFRTVTPNVSGDWLIDGTGTPGAVVTIHVGVTNAGPAVGTITIAADGRWRFSAAGSPVLPDPTSTISVQTSTGATRLAFPLVVR